MDMSNDPINTICYQILHFWINEHSNLRINSTKSTKNCSQKIQIEHLWQYMYVALRHMQYLQINGSVSLYITTLLCSFYCKHLPPPEMKTWSPGTIRGHQPHFLVLSLPFLFLLTFAPYPPDQVNSFHCHLFDLSFGPVFSAFFPFGVFDGWGFSVSVSPLFLLLCLKVLLLWK